MGIKLSPSEEKSMSIQNQGQFNELKMQNFVNGWVQLQGYDTAV